MKAWLSCMGAEYPRTHDLAALLALLEDCGANVPSGAQSLVHLTDFAVQFRYEAFEDLELTRDRAELGAQVSALIDGVGQTIVDAAGAEDH